MADRTMELTKDRCPNPECDDPVERHTAFWNGCKYCPCGWLPEVEAAGMLLFDLIRTRKFMLAGHPGLAHLAPEALKALMDGFGTAEKALRDAGYEPRYREHDMLDGTAEEVLADERRAS